MRRKKKKKGFVMTIVSNDAELMSALSMAVGGETIELTPGDFGEVTIKDKLFPSDVTIISADPANPAVIRDLTIKRSSHLAFDGILFDYVNAPTDPTWVKPFAVFDSSFITIRNSVLDGDEVPSPTGGTGDYGIGYGLWVQDSNNVVFANNEVFKFRKALVFMSCSIVSITANDMHTFLSDGITISSVDGVLIEGNWLHDFKIDPTGSDHPDMIQFGTVLGQMSSKNVIIRGNFLDTGVGSWTQSIFIRNNVVDQGLGSFADAAYLNLLIELNVIYNAHAHGITVGETDGLTIRNNTLLYNGSVDDGRTGGNGSPRIIPDDASINVTIESNITGDVWNWDTVITHPGWTVGNNLLVQPVDPTAENYYGDLFVNPFAVPANLADLRAKAGGVIEAGVIGAEMTRADILMLVGPYASAPETNTCETLLANALDMVDDLEAWLTAAQSALAIMTDERDVALVERDAAEGALVSMTLERNVAVAAQAVAEDALANMTTARDAALAKLAAIVVIAEGT